MGWGGIAGIGYISWTYGRVFGIHENDGINIWTKWEFFFACVFFLLSLWVEFFVGYKYKHTHRRIWRKAFQY